MINQPERPILRIKPHASPQQNVLMEREDSERDDSARNGQIRIKREPQGSEDLQRVTECKSSPEGRWFNSVITISGRSHHKTTELLAGNLFARSTSPRACNFNRSCCGRLLTNVSRYGRPISLATISYMIDSGSGILTPYHLQPLVRSHTRGFDRSRIPEIEPPNSYTTQLRQSDGSSPPKERDEPGTFKCPGQIRCRSCRFYYPAGDFDSYVCPTIDVLST